MKPTRKADGPGLLKALKAALPGIERRMKLVGKGLENQHFHSKKSILPPTEKPSLK